MQTTKALVKEGDVGIITCPYCRRVKKMSVAQYREKGKRKLLIKCSCDKVFCLCLEYRKHPRKPVELLGRSVNLSLHRETQDIIIRNISLGGVGFSPPAQHRTRKDARLQVSFALKDCKNTFLDTDVIVRAASRDYVSCEFNNPEAYRPSLGFFLLG